LYVGECQCQDAHGRVCMLGPGLQGGRTIGEVGVRAVLKSFLWRRMERFLEFKFSP